MTNAGFDDRLKVPSWFTAPRMTAGIPRGTFLILVLASLFYGLLIAWWLGLLLFVVTYSPLAKAHKEDPAALRVWLYTLSSGVDRLSVSRLSRLKITLE